MQDSGRRRQRSASLAGTSRSLGPVATQVEASAATAAPFSSGPGHMREATLAAEFALRQYQAEPQPAYASFPYQVQRKPVPQQSLRHPTGTVGSSNQLQRIPEVASEGSSGEAAAKQHETMQNASTMPSALRAGGPSPIVQHDRAASMEENSRALPRNFDPVIGRKQDVKQGSRRPSLPYMFEPPSAVPSQRGEFPNPHQSAAEPSDSQLSTAQLQRRASQQMQSPILSRSSSSFGPDQTNERKRRNQDNPYEFGIPPTPPLGQQAAFQTVPLSIKKARQVQPAASPATIPRDVSTSSAWSSNTESEPTPTPSSIAATRERNAQLEAELMPVQLTLPPRLSSSSISSPVQAVKPPAIGAHFGGPGATERPAAIPAVTVKAADVASIKASAAPFAPAKSSNLSAPPIRSNSDDTSYSGDTVALPDGTQIPTVRTDFQNLKRISLPRPAASTGKKVPMEQLANIGGHVIAREDAKMVPKNDGSSRTIYSPTPQTLAAARRQSTLLQVPPVSGQGQTTSDQGIPSPLSASIEAPSAPQIPHSLKFDRPAPSVGASTSYEPQQLSSLAPERKGAEVPGDMRSTETTHSKPEDTDSRTRKEAESLEFADRSRRNTFGEPVPSMLEEANRKLFLYQMQQGDQDAHAKGVGSSRQSAMPPTLPPNTQAEPIGKAEQKPEQAVATTSTIVRRESSASQQSRRDSIGSATTAFDSPTREDFPTNLFRQPSVTGSVKTGRGITKKTVAPPSDVQEVQEPDEAEAINSADDGDDGTEIDDHEGTYDLSLERRVPFVVDTYTSTDQDGNDFRELKDGAERSDFRFIPISSVKAGKARRPRTRDTRVSFRSNPSHVDQQRPGSRQHGAIPTCRQCFRAGFDCAMNLQLGEGTAARKAFQDFVAAGGLNAFSIRDGPAFTGGRPRTAGSLVDSNAGRITVEEALGRNYVDKLGEIAFGESALSRPVTRGMYNELLEEKQEQDMRKQLAANHKPWSAEEDEIDVAKRHSIKDQDQQRQSTERLKRSLSIGNKDRRLSQLTLQDGIDDDRVNVQDEDARQVLLNNLKRSESHKRRELEEGEIVDIDPADYEDEGDFDGEEGSRFSSASSDSDAVFWADRWSVWAKVRQLLVYWVIVFALQALVSGYTNTVVQIIVDEEASEAIAILYQLGALSFNGSQGSGLFSANLFVGFGRQRITLISLVAIAVVCAIAGFMHNVYALLACLSILGLASGLLIFLSLATVMDIFATSQGRLLGVSSIALVLVGGQLAGPWISKRVLEFLHWPWTFWLTIIPAAVLVVYDGLFTRETAAFVLFRRHALKIKRTGQGWTPEPQSETHIRQVFGDDGPRPVRLLRYNPMLNILSLAIAALAGMYMFLFSGLQALFIRVHGLTNNNAALAVAVSAAIGLIIGVVTVYLLNSKRGTRNGAGGFATKARPLYLDEKGHIDTRRPLRAKVESLLVTGLHATAAFSFALFMLALTSSFATTWLLTAFGVVLATASLMAVGMSLVQYVMDGYSMPRRVTLRDVVAREEVSTPTLLQNEDDDRFTSYSRRTAGRLAAATAAGAARFEGGRNGRHGHHEHERLHKTDDQDEDDRREAWLDAGENVVKQRDKRWLDEMALAAVTAIVSLSFTSCSALSLVSFEAFGKLSFGAYAVIFASATLVVLLSLLCVYLYGAKPRARSLSVLDELDADRAHNRRARLREKRAARRRQLLSQSSVANDGQSQAIRNRKRNAPMRLAHRLVDALGYKPISDDALDMYRRSEAPAVRRVRTPAPTSQMREVETRSTATDAADGRRELWLAKFIANRDKIQSGPEPVRTDPRPAPAIRLNEATEVPPRPTSSNTHGGGNGLKQSMKSFGGVMFGRTTNNDSPNAVNRNVASRTLNASTSLPNQLHSTTGIYSSPPINIHPLSPPPRAQPRASISHNLSPVPARPDDGFEIVQFQQSPQKKEEAERRPITPVMTRKSVDLSKSRVDIMTRSHSQPLNLYAAGRSPPPVPAVATQMRGERQQRQWSGQGL